MGVVGALGIIWVSFWDGIWGQRLPSRQHIPSENTLLLNPASTAQKPTSGTSDAAPAPVGSSY